MKKGLIAIFMAMVSMTAFAQRQDSNATPEQRAENQTKMMTESLKLTDDQQKQVYTLALARVNKMQELRAAGTQDRTQMRASMETFNTEINKILTPEQQEKYKADQAERRGNGGGRGGQRNR